MFRGMTFLLGAAVLALAPTVSRAQAPAKLPTDLDLVPRDAAGFVHVRAAELWKSEWLGDVRRLVDKAGPDCVQAFLKKFSPDLSTIDRMTFVMLTPKSLDELVPDLLPEIPTDPFDGKPLRYRATTDGFVVYSVYQDKRDDGGVSDPRAPFALDLAFRVTRSR